MKIFVTGGAGYIGSHSCKELARRGHEVVVYDNLSTGHIQFVRWGKFEHGDMRELNALRAALHKHKPDGVIHFAASAYVGESVENPGKYIRNNVFGSLNLLEAMRDEGAGALVVSSSCAVYGQPEIVPISEDTPTNPVNPYGATKLYMERMLRDFETAHGLHWLALRYFNAAGSSPDGEIGEIHEPETHLAPRVMLAAQGKIPTLSVFGDDYDTPDGTCIRDYISVNDLAKAHAQGIEYLLQGGDSCALNLGTSNGASVREIIRMVEKVSGKKAPWEIRPRRPGDPAKLVANASLAEKTLGWKAEESLEEMLAHAWRFSNRH